MWRKLIPAALLFFASEALSSDTEMLRAFSGHWYSFEPRTGTAQGTCAMTLSTQPAPNGGFLASAEFCAAPLDQVTLWGIIEGQVRLVGAAGQIATLGGHQLRMSGEMAPDAAPLVLERASGDQNAQALSKALATYRCLFAGYSTSCASPEQLQIAKNSSYIVSLVDLNMRSEPRSDAAISHVMPRRSLATVELCLIAADGPWCRVGYEGVTAWVARNALRKSTWPVLTFSFVN